VGKGATSRFFLMALGATDTLFVLVWAVFFDAGFGAGDLNRRNSFVGLSLVFLILCRLFGLISRVLNGDVGHVVLRVSDACAE
jgi:hypothetical protein